MMEQMVCSHNGHGYRVGTHELGSISYPGVILSLDCLFHPQCSYIHHGLHYLHSAIHLVSRDLASDDPGSY